jgi:hypothetical protein
MDFYADKALLQGLCEVGIDLYRNNGVNTVSYVRCGKGLKFLSLGA